jgi:hypothetical protein
MLSTLPLEGFSRIPVERTIILDPWLEPLPSPGPVPLGSSPSSRISAAEEVINSEEAMAISSRENDLATLDVSHSRMLIINSETFTLWKDHYARLQEVVAGWEPHGGKILTLGMVSTPLYIPLRYTELMFFELVLSTFLSQISPYSLFLGRDLPSLSWILLPNFLSLSLTINWTKPLRRFPPPRWRSLSSESRRMGSRKENYLEIPAMSSSSKLELSGRRCARRDPGKPYLSRTMYMNYSLLGLKPFILNATEQ